MAIEAAHQIPAAGFEAAITNADDVVPRSDLRLRWNERLEPNEQRFAARGIAHLRHIVIGSDHVAGRHPPVLAKKIRKIELRSLATVARIDAYNPRQAALYGREQDLAM